nr:YdhR family protein [Rhodoferax sp.]
MTHNTALRAGAALLATAALGTSVWAQTTAPQMANVPPTASPTPVVVIVRVPKPWYAPRAVVAGKMRDTIPQYAHLPGLAFKAFSFERESGDFGGVYYWRDAASAQAWFNPAWFARVKAERGADASVRIFEAPVSVDNTPSGTPASTDSSAVATLVEIPLPKGIGRERMLAEFNATVPQYQKVPGLLRKHFILSQGDSSNGTFGGVYLWRDEASAKAWFNAAWHQRVTQTYGQSAKIEWFDAPILLPSLDTPNTIAPPALLVAAP